MRGKLIGHRIKYWMKKDNEYNSTLEVKESQYVLSRSTKSEALIIGLLPNEYYYVRVMAYNSAGGFRIPMNGNQEASALQTLVTLKAEL